ncbi:MAG: hypothetical protein R2698_06475 [Microthrixaceae bacterium]
MFKASTALIDPLLGYLWQHGATDLHLAADSVPRVRIDGKLLAVPDSPPLTSEFVGSAIRDLLSESDQQGYQAERQFDFAFSWADTARFRANAFYQLDRPALALRLIPRRSPHPNSSVCPPCAASWSPDPTAWCWSPAPPVRASPPRWPR